MPEIEPIDLKLGPELIGAEILRRLAWGRHSGTLEWIRGERRLILGFLKGRPEYRMSGGESPRTSRDDVVSGLGQFALAGSGRCLFRQHEHSVKSSLQIDTIGEALKAILQHTPEQYLKVVWQVRGGSILEPNTFFAKLSSAIASLGGPALRQPATNIQLGALVVGAPVPTQRAWLAVLLLGGFQPVGPPTWSEQIEAQRFSALLLKLFKGRLSGHLAVQHEGRSKYLRFAKGQLISASSNIETELLGNLLRRGKPEEGQRIDEAVAIALEQSRTVGWGLTQIGLLNEVELNRWLQRQARDRIFDLFRWSQGSARFYADPRTEQARPNVRLPILDLLRTAAENRSESAPGDTGQTLSELFARQDRLLLVSSPDEALAKELLPAERHLLEYLHESPVPADLLADLEATSPDLDHALRTLSVFSEMGIITFAPLPPSTSDLFAVAIDPLPDQPTDADDSREDQPLLDAPALTETPPSAPEAFPGPQDSEGEGGNLVSGEEERVAPAEGIDAQRGPAMEFSLEMIQAILGIGFYMPNRPEREGALDGLYQLFTQLMRGQGEVSFYCVTTAEGNRILLDGVFDTYMPLRKLLMSERGKMFLEKLFDIFKRRRLLSIEIKGTASKEELIGFIEVLSMPFGLDHKHEREAVEEELSKRKIVRCSLVFREDVIKGKRRVDWRTEIAMAKLDKELKKNAIATPRPSELGARSEVFRDIVAAVKQTRLFKQLVLNADVLQERLETGFEVDVIAEIVHSIPPSAIPHVIRDVLAERNNLLQTGATGGLLAEVREGLLHMIGEAIPVFVDLLATEDSDDGNEILKELFWKGNIKGEQLSPSLRKALAAHEKVGRFIAHRHEIFERLANTQDHEEYAKLGDRIVGLIPEMLRQTWVEGETDVSRYEDVVTAVKIFASHSQDSDSGSRRTRAAQDLILRICGPEHQQELTDAFIKAKKETREHLMIVFDLLGAKSVRSLVAILRSSDDQWVRKATLDTLVRIGPEAIAPIQQEVRRPENPWFFTCYLIEALGQVGGEAIAESLVELFTHQTPRVRKAAFDMYVTLAGRSSKPALLKHIRDDDPDVQAALLHHLGTMKSRDPPLLEVCLGAIFAGYLDNEPRAHERVQIQACFALSKMGNARTPSGETVEETLVSMLCKKKKLMQRLKSRQLERSVPVRQAMIDTLGATGTKVCLKCLKSIAKDKDSPPALQASAERAIASVNERQ